MICLRHKCICKNCRPRRNSVPIKMTKNDFSHKAKLAYAIGTLWKRIGKDFEEVAKNTK